MLWWNIINNTKLFWKGKFYYCYFIYLFIIGHFYLLFRTGGGKESERDPEVARENYEQKVKEAKSRFELENWIELVEGECFETTNDYGMNINFSEQYANDYLRGYGGGEMNESVGGDIVTNDGDYGRDNTDLELNNATNESNISTSSFQSIHSSTEIAQQASREAIRKRRETSDKTAKKLTTLDKNMVSNHIFLHFNISQLFFLIIYRERKRLRMEKILSLIFKPF